MADLQINIDQNGTTTLATAGKYCDRDIAVCVDVAAGPTPTVFNNLLTDPNTLITPEHRLSSSTVGNLSAQTGAFVAELTIPAGRKTIFRFRGFVPYNSTMCYSRDGGTTWAACYLRYKYTDIDIDPYGDAIIGTTLGATAVVDLRVRLNLSVMGATTGSAMTEAQIRSSGAIMTLDEPIGIVIPEA